MANEVNVESRFLKYDKDDVERLLDKVNDTTVASEESVRGIVKNWTQSAVSESEPESEPEEVEEVSGE